MKKEIYLEFEDFKKTFLDLTIKHFNEEEEKYQELVITIKRTTLFSSQIKDMKEDLKLFNKKTDFFLYNKNQDLTSITRLFVSCWGRGYFYWGNKKYILK